MRKRTIAERSEICVSISGCGMMPKRIQKDFDLHCLRAGICDRSIKQQVRIGVQSVMPSGSISDTCLPSYI